MCVCLLLSHPAIWLRENAQVRLSIANMTFWAHLNCCNYGWRQMMSSPISPQPLKTLPVVWRCPCHAAEKLLSPSLFCLCPCVCVYCTTLCVCVCNESPALDEGVAPVLPGVVFWSHSFTWHPQASWPHNLSQQTLPSTWTEPNIVLSRSRKRERACKPINIMLYLDAYSAVTALTHSFEQRLSQSSFVFVDCSFCWNYCRCKTVMPLLTNVLLWIPGADIVQWLMKNLSIEDPGMPAEQSVITCKHNRAQLKRKAISNHASLPSVCLLSCQQLKPSTLGVWSLPMATSSQSLTTSWHLKTMEPFIAFRYRNLTPRGVLDTCWESSE